MNLSLPTSAGGSRPGTAAIAPITYDVPFEVKELLWNQIKKFLKPSEMEEIQRILGKTIIEENEVLRVGSELLTVEKGLVQEINSLLDIWKEFRLQNDDQIKTATPRSQPKLPEPPGRELLETKISLLLADLKKAALEHGRDITSTIPLETPRDKEIFHYFEKEKDATVWRPRSASVSERDLRQSVERPVEKRHPASARASVPSLEIDRITHHLNVYDIQKVEDQIKQALQDENKLLIDDVEYLHKCLDEEWTYKNKAISAAKTPTVPPPLQELKEFGNKLERKKKFLSEMSTTKPKTAVSSSLNRPMTSGSPLKPPRLPPKFEEKKLVS